MRSGGVCSLQQALTPEATAVVKQAVTLAKRRGHAQVTPLHVANTMLSTSTGLLRAACLKSHSHPLQCKALELCFNVALNRLPAATSAPMFGVHNSSYHHVPSISNALIAAFKRAQAHQRRGSIENNNNNQSLLAVKIELNQLVISILDDPSVSRVMREAGFSSSQVKSNVERPSGDTISIENGGLPRPGDSSTITTQHRVTDEDVTYVIENMADRRRRSIVVVAESIDTADGVMRGVMDKLNKGSDVPDILKSLKFINFSLSSFEHLSREEFQQQLEHLRTHLNSDHTNDGSGVVLFLGDLKWVAERRAHYRSVQHMIIELGKLIHGVGENNGRLSLIGTASLQSYMRCKNGCPSLETAWRLHPVTVPSGGLCLSLVSDSEFGGRVSSKESSENGLSIWLVSPEESDKHPISCVEWPSDFNNNGASHSTSSLPIWLQQYKDEKNGTTSSTDDDKECLQRKGSSNCSSIHGRSQSSERTLKFSPLSPSTSSSLSTDQLNPSQNQINWTPAARNFWNSTDPSVDLNLAPTPSHVNSPSNSASSSDIMEIEYVPRFNKHSTENMKILTHELEKRVPWHKGIIPEIATTILKCQSGIIPRRGEIESDGKMKNETWLLFQGADRDGKQKIARELARVVFGSYANFVHFSSPTFYSRSGSPEDGGRKRLRDGYFERFAEEVSNNPHRVFLLQSVEEADYGSQIGFKRAIERGEFKNSFGDEVDLSDAIIIFSSEIFRSRFGECTSFSIRHKPCGDGAGEEEKETVNTTGLSLDLNVSIDEATNAKDGYSGADVGIFESIDARIIFKIQEL